MSKKQLSFLEQADALDKENKLLHEQLINYKKLIDNFLKLELGMDLKTVKRAISASVENQNNESEFERKICEFYKLEYYSDKEDFLRIMLSESSLNYFQRGRDADIL